ncbi:MAG: MucBP domain-containing protein, partial [Treponema sp.]|nr:MucBP domain-containing protein [Treponema sp.]
VVSQGRKKVMMQMDGTESEEPTPVPPKEGATITVSYLSDGTAIHDETRITAEIGKPFEMEAPAMEGYTADKCYIDGELQEGTTAQIEEVTADTAISFVYAESDVPEFFRYLVNGLFTKDDGSLSSGWHLYKKIDIDAVSLEEGFYTITCEDLVLVHEDGGQTLKIEVGAKMELIPSGAFVKVTEILRKDNGNVTFNAVPFEPTEAERNAYVCGYYD